MGRTITPAWLLVAPAILLLAACGGGSPGNAPAQPQSGAALPASLRGVFSEQVKLTADPPDAGGQLGAAVAIDGDTAVAGYSGIPPLHAGNSKAYVFLRGADGWSIQSVLTPGDGEPNNQFGASVAIDGDTILVADQYGHITEVGPYFNEYSGAVYVFVRSGESWSPQATLLPSAPTTFDDFGQSVALSGDTALVASGRGAYVFFRSGTTWSQQDQLFSDGTIYLEDGYWSVWDDGLAIALDGDTALVGANGEFSAEDVGSPEDTLEGLVLVYQRSGTNWDRQAILSGDGVLDGGRRRGPAFGFSVAIDGDTALVRAEDAAHVFVRSETDWSRQGRLIVDETSFTGGLNSFVSTMAVAGDTAVVGDQYSDEAGANSGSVQVFRRSGDTWNEDPRLVAGDAAAGDLFGKSVAIDGHTVVVGAPGVDDGGDNSGAAYVFSDLVTLTVPIDIKPGSGSNPVNLGSQGVIPVAILGSGDFDVSTVDVATLAFGPGGAVPAHTAGGHLEDVNGDGLTDLVSHYRTQDAALEADATEACVTGQTLDGTPLQGCEPVRIVP